MIAQKEKLIAWITMTREIGDQIQALADTLVADGWAGSESVTIVHLELARVRLMAIAEVFKEDLIYENKLSPNGKEDWPLGQPSSGGTKSGGHPD